MPLKANCLHCNKEFFDKPYMIIKKGRKFCSSKCAYEHRKESSKIEVECAYCKATVYKKPSQLRNSKSGLYFCNRACKESAQKLGGIKEIQPAHYGNGNDTKTYRRIAFDFYPPKCNRCNYHKNESVLQVHHVDRDRNNNSVNNLEILCANCHLEEHYTNKDGPFSKRT